jgi:hypothetical protein
MPRESDQLANGKAESRKLKAANFLLCDSPKTENLQPENLPNHD